MLLVHDLKNIPAVFLLVALALGVNMLWGSMVFGAPSADLWSRWQVNSPSNSEAIDHGPWNVILKKYLILDHPSQINRFRYADVTSSDREKLENYILFLQKIKVTSLNVWEQKAYWVNLYNALTVQVVLDHYPVKSINDIDISPGFFSSGPWDAKLLVIEGEKVSLNDIDHRILRPIFKDNRLHYALNCASLGCPNLQPEAFTPVNMKRLLEKGATEYINSSRGAMMVGRKLQVSSIYKWFQADFGGNEQGVLQHLRQYAKGTLAETLKTYNGRLRFEYDWGLNQP